MARPLRFTRKDLELAIRASKSWAETLRRLGYRSAGGNWRTLQKYAALWEISTEHFDANAARTAALSAANRPVPLSKVMVQNSTYSRASLKARLFSEGIKKRRCESCGQGEIWRGRLMALILDHVNGVPDDHRLDNLRVLCPNCAATLATHCARKNRVVRPPRTCHYCSSVFVPRSTQQRYCSSACGSRHANRSNRGKARPRSRKVERPPYEQLMREIEQTSYLAVGRKYGVSDNAIRKWVRFYESERERQNAERDGVTAASA